MTGVNPGEKLNSAEKKISQYYERSLTFLRPLSELHACHRRVLAACGCTMNYGVALPNRETREVSRKKPYARDVNRAVSIKIDG